MKARDELEEWLAEARKKGATHVIVAVDTFDGGSFPVYVMPGESLERKVRKYANLRKMRAVAAIHEVKRSVRPPVLKAICFLRRGEPVWAGVLDVSRFYSSPGGQA